MKLLERDMFADDKGFTILEIFLGMTIFMIGLLGIAALQISSIRAEAFSSRISEGTMLARSTFEELMALEYEDALLDDSDFSGRVGNVSSGDPDFANDADMTTHRKDDDGANAGIADNRIPDAFDAADHSNIGIGTNSIFGVGWSICEDCLLEETKSIRVIVYWQVKGEFQTIDFFGLIPRS